MRASLVIGDTLRVSRVGCPAPRGGDREAACCPRPARCPHLILIAGALLSTALLSTAADALSLDAKALEGAFVEAVKRAGPAVVHISAQKAGRVAMAPVDLRDLMLGRRRFYRREPVQGLGSGVIVSADGLILTNHHVAGDADRITVTLADGREYSAKLVGTDEKTEVCVLRIGGHGHPYAELGESDKIEVGQWALAIGNPFGLDHTVTLGIISARGRRGIVRGEGVASGEGYEDFIQTDAAINPGNSGGPLVNIEGEVIGINTAIYSHTGGNMGVGFAIPSDLARVVMQGILKHGRVIRSWLGVGIQDVTADLAPALDLPKAEGVIITEVRPRSPASKTSLRRGDVIVTLDGRKVQGAGDLRNRVAHSPVGSEVEIGFLREGKGRTVTARLEKHPSERGHAADAPDETPETPEATGTIGVTLRRLTPDIARRLGLDGTSGLLAVRIRPGSAAEAAGLRAYDVILEAGGRKLQTLRDFVSARRDFEAGKAMLLLVRRGRNTMYVAVRPRE